MNWTWDHVYSTVVTNLEPDEAVWVGERKREDTLAAFFRELGPKRRRNVVGVASALGPAYLAANAAAIPRAIHLLDRFHVIYWVNEVLATIRRGVFGGPQRDDVGQHFKVKTWLLLRAHEALDLSQKRHLAKLLKCNRTLQRAYLLKESLRGSFQYA